MKFEFETLIRIFISINNYKTYFLGSLNLINILNKYIQIIKTNVFLLGG